MIKRHAFQTLILTFSLTGFLSLTGCGQGQDPVTKTADTAVSKQSVEATTVGLTDEQIENIVRRSYRFVAIYNVNNKGAFDTENPFSTGGLNRILANTRLADHTMQGIARPNNDTLYVSSLIDLSREPVIIDSPAFDSKYVSMMITAYDHYVNIPMSTRQGDFSEPSRILLYSARTPVYSGEAIEGIDKVAEMTGDFVSAVYRVMPHANEPERMQRNLDAMQTIKAIPLSEFLTGVAAPEVSKTVFPDFGRTDFDVFENNLLEVMQFVFNHATFDANDEIDRALLAAFEPLGVVPGREFDPKNVAKLNGAKFRAAAESIFEQEMARTMDPQFFIENITRLFQPKGHMTDELLLFQSILGPLGQPATEAVYPGIATADGVSMNAMNDYVVHMTAEQMPPATAFWSLTLYDTANGFFMPNDHKKYSVGENAGMEFDADGGISIYISAEQPEGVPDENWLPLVRGDYAVDLIMRIYAPDLGRFADWTPPRAVIVE